MTNCPKCASADTKVQETGLKRVEKTWYRRRRRKCEDCDSQFTTYEVSESDFKRLYNTDGVKRAFNELAAQLKSLGVNVQRP